jgi:3-hydroxybutyryl-CoA dehydrogenase
MNVTIDLGSGDILVGVVGAGAMGRGIAQVAATGGCRVRLFDTRPGVAAEARDFIASMVDRAAEKGRMSAEDAAAARARLEVVEAVREFAGCNVVIEAVVEDVGVKRKVFAELEDTVSPETLLASNTSSLSVTSIAATCRNPERVAGMHFFNPAPLMRLVEVIAGARTDPAVTDALVALAERMGKVAVRVADAPGFLVNQVGRGYTIESAHIVSEGVASTFDIDRILRDGVGFRMGPFELMDLTALDVTHPATEAIYRQFYDEPRYRPSLLIALRHEAGLLGRKTKRGFYDYTSGSQVGPAEQPPAPYDGRPVWIDDSEPDLSRHLRDIVVDAGGTLESGAAPSGNALILVTPVGGDATTACAERGLDARRTVAVDMLFGVDRRRTLMRTPLTTVDASAAARGLLGGGDVPATVINDSPGFVAQRVIASIVNIGSAVAQARTATPGDIDTAVTLALNYPNGPLGFGDAAGPATVLRILETIQRLTGDPRYRPSPWLRRRAQLGVSLLTPEE